MKRLLAITLLAAAASAPTFAQDIATVNGTAITQSSLDTAVKAMVARGASDTPEFRKQVRDDLINRAVLVQTAEKQGLDKSPEVQAQLSDARQQILIAGLMKQYVEKNPVSDTDLKNAYNDISKKAASEKEYKVKHILVKDEAAAQKLIKEIQSKKISFADAAKKNSIDTGSGKAGGDLGWAPASTYVPEFADAVKGATKGKLLAKPVKSQFGWHIIEVDDSRAIPAPKFDDIKEQLKQMVTQQNIQKYLQDLRKNAKITENSK